MTQSDSVFLGREPVWQTTGFVGRAQAIAWVADKLGRDVPQNCNIIGEPRAGKTSLLYHLYTQQVGLPPQTRGLYVWVRLVELADYRPASFWQLMLDRLHAAQETAVVVEQEEQEEQDARDLFDTFSEEIEQLIDDGMQRIIFIIDDFDVLVPGLQSQDLNWLRSLTSRYKDQLAFVIGTIDSLVWLADQVVARADEETSQMVSPLANVFLNFSLGLLTGAEAEALCRQTAVSQGVELTEADLSFLLTEAGRHPDLLKPALVYLLEARRFSEPDEVHEDARSDFRFDSHVRWLCERLFQRRTPEEQQILRALAAGDEVDDRVMVNRLKRQLGLVEKRNGRLALFADAFAYWVARMADVDGGDVDETAVGDDTPDSFDYLPAQRMVRLSNGEEARLTPLENRLLAYFVEHVNHVCTTEELLANVWGPDKSRAVVEKGVNRLRAKVEHDPKRPRFILSARGEGYLLRMPVGE